ncbi:MAG: TCR/Tet family MFS transporter [Myxococcaceae bacterium]|nr:TCR/Tet family MFS transporter [Myxococcaceae bacterium]
MVAAPASKAAVTFIFITVLLDVLALGIIIPVGPHLIVQLDGSDFAHASEVSGLFGFTFALMQFLFSPVVGMLSDRVGRRPVVLMSNLGLGADYLVMALAPTLSWLFVARLVSGITAASISTAFAYISDTTAPEHRAQKFGLIGAAFGLGFVIGPAIGGTLGQVDLRLPFYVAASLSLLNFTYGFFILPESLPKERRTPFDLARANPLGSLQLLRSSPVLLGLAVASFCGFLAHEALPAIFVLYAAQRYGWTQRDVGLMLAGVGVASSVVQGGLIRPAMKKLGERLALLVGLACGLLSFVIYGIAPTGLFILCGIPFGAFWGLWGPSSQAMMTRELAPNQQGKFQGALSSLRGISGMLGPLLYTQVFAFAVAGGSFVGLPFLVGASILALALVLVLATLRQVKPPVAA